MTIPDPDPTLPTVDEIGALLRARTQDTNDEELGTFTDDTRPTDTEVERIIAQAAAVVYGSTGDLSDLECQAADNIREGAKYNISLLAACLIELSYFPEQVRSDRSAFQAYYDILTGDMGMRALLDSVAECRGGEVEPDGEGIPGSASWAFPIDCGGMVGWQTKW
jgi:hypothetical protein